MPKRLKKQDLDENQTAFAAVERLSGLTEPASFEAQFKAHMADLGRKGGKASGAKRMKNLTPEQRKKIASAAAQARWAKKKKAKKR